MKTIKLYDESSEEILEETVGKKTRNNDGISEKYPQRVSAKTSIRITEG